MRFILPLFPVEFELPADWWAESGMADFTITGSAFRSTPEATLILLRDIEPPFRFPESHLDWKGFNQDRMISILQGIATGAEIEPVPLYLLPPLPHEFLPAPFRYRVLDGYHRFYASIAAGYEYLPTVIK